MNFTSVALALALIAFSCITYSHSLKCYACKNDKECLKPKEVVCDAANANATRDYLNFHYNGVDENTIGTQFTCIKDVLKITKRAEYEWMGCTYIDLGGCVLDVRNHYTSSLSKYTRCCSLCDDKDGCNPAGRAATDNWTLLATLAVAAFAQYLWRN